MSISHDELKRAQQIARDLRITQEREDEINPHPEELHRTAEKAARLIEEWALRLEWQQRDLERMRLLTRDHASQSWTNACIHDAEELLQKVQQIERENESLIENVRGLEPMVDRLERENAALREKAERYRLVTLRQDADNTALCNKLAALENQTQWECSCGGTDCEGMKENAALREDKERLDWIASRQSTQLVYFTAAGWAIIKASGGDLLHERNIHDLRTAIDAARTKEDKP